MQGNLSIGDMLALGDTVIEVIEERGDYPDQEIRIRHVDQCQCDYVEWYPVVEWLYALGWHKIQRKESV